MLECLYQKGWDIVSKASRTNHTFLLTWSKGQQRASRQRPS